MSSAPRMSNPSAMSYPACSSRLRTMSAGRSVGASTRSVGTEMSTMRFDLQCFHRSYLFPSLSSATYVAPPQGPATASYSVVVSAVRQSRLDRTARRGTSCLRGISGRDIAPCCRVAVFSACVPTFRAHSRPTTNMERSGPHPPSPQPSFLALSTTANLHPDMHA